MMNVKETLKRLHKKFPMMGLDELFDILDCYVEEVGLSGTISTWEPAKIWYSTDKTTGEIPKINSITSNEAEPAIYTIINNCADGKLKYYDGGGSVQLTGHN